MRKDLPLDACELSSLKEALKLFELDHIEYIPTTEQIRKQYKRLCLKYHPDKNAGETVQQFQHIQEAYLFLYEEAEEAEEGSNDDVSISQTTQLPTWLQPILQTIYDLKHSTLVNKMVQLLESKVKQWAESLDKEALLKLYGFIKRTGRDLPHDTPESTTISGLHSMEELLRGVLKAKLAADKHLKIEPKLEDIFACNVYRHIEVDGNGKERLLMIPTWMEESIFDMDTDIASEFIVTCIPQCPQRVHIDDARNVHKYVKYHLLDLWGKGGIDEEICPGVQVHVVVADLHLREYQTLVYRHLGIPKGNTNDMFEVSKKSDVILHIEIIQ